MEGRNTVNPKDTSAYKMIPKEKPSPGTIVMKSASSLALDELTEEEI